ncbi:hypothetical protein EVAR_36467_1 [Eumeta japonica]|uniref:Uncharacterized protein n=1 Tax=Eumeta variegata TaxID=151549 RepID=A0A4C1WUF6_EUMVA|nr:hypothetical protein EVAR_36467_1 [Eumeta japonica]
MLANFLPLGDTRKRYVFQETSWNNEIKRCWSGGEGGETKSYTIGNLTVVGLNYDDIDELTTVLAIGTLVATTNGAQLYQSRLLLDGYTTGGEYKSFTHHWGYEAVCGWGKQRAGMTLTVKFLKNGAVTLDNYVTAASWGAVTCANSVAYVSSVSVVN